MKNLLSIILNKHIMKEVFEIRDVEEDYTKGITVEDETSI